MAEPRSSQPHEDTPPRYPRDPAGQAGAAPRSRARSIAVLVVTCALTVLAGGPGGLIWAAVAPRALVTVAGHGAAGVVNPETSAFIAADGWFYVIGVAGGLACGLAGYLMIVRRRGAPAAAALIIGAAGASLIAWWIGTRIGLSGFHADLAASHAGAVLHAPLMLRAHSALASWPFGASLAVAGAELVAGPRNRPPRTAGATGSAWARAGQG